MPVLRTPEGRIGEGDASGGSAEPGQAQLVPKQVGTDKGQRVGEEEEEVVDDEGGVRALFGKQTSRRVADERVREGERVGERPERVRLEGVQRLVEERLT